jgi:hypothetical protein
MKFRGFIAPLTMLGIIGLSLWITVNVQREAIAKLRRVPPFLETWELAGRSGNAMKYMTLRYDGVAADFLWLRAIQSFGGRGMTNRDWVPLYNLFDAITELDPYFEAAYTFGNLVIGDEGGKQREALRLLDKGTLKIYKHYRSPFEGLYVSQWSLSDPKLATYYGRVAKKRADAPDWLPRIVAYVEIASGQFYIGYDRYLRNLLEAIDQKSVVLQDIALNKSAETIMFWNASVLAEAIDRHTSAKIDVAGLAPLIAAAQVELRDAVNQIDISRGSSLNEYQQDIFKLSLVKKAAVPSDPYGKGMAMNLAQWWDAEKPLKERLTSIRFVSETAGDILRGLRGSVERRKTELERNPKDLREVFFTDLKTTEPLGGQWIYDPETATVRASSFPEL